MSECNAEGCHDLGVCDSASDPEIMVAHDSGGRVGHIFYDSAGDSDGKLYGRDCYIWNLDQLGA